MASQPSRKHFLRKHCCSSSAEGLNTVLRRKADDSVKPAVQPPATKGKAADASAAQLSYGKLEFGEGEACVPNTNSHHVAGTGTPS